MGRKEFYLIQMDHKTELYAEIFYNSKHISQFANSFSKKKKALEVLECLHQITAGLIMLAKTLKAL